MRPLASSARESTAVLASGATFATLSYAKPITLTLNSEVLWHGCPGQQIAIKRVVESIRLGQRRILATLATGTGKICVAVQGSMWWWLDYWIRPFFSA
jgi:hypothetical protein